MLCFVQGDQQITKVLKRQDWLTPFDVEYSVYKKGREAERDFAYLKHGPGYIETLRGKALWELDAEAKKKLLAITP